MLMLTFFTKPKKFQAVAPNLQPFLLFNYPFKFSYIAVGNIYNHTAVFADKVVVVGFFYMFVPQLTLVKLDWDSQPFLGKGINYPKNSCLINPNSMFCQIALNGRNIQRPFGIFQCGKDTKPCGCRLKFDIMQFFQTTVSKIHKC